MDDHCLLPLSRGHHITAMPRLLARLLALHLLALFAIPAWAGTANTITIRGRVLDTSGAPLRDTWVFTQGSRRLSAMVGADGAYVLRVPSPTFEEIARVPFTLRVMARHPSVVAPTESRAPGPAYRHRR